MYARVFMRSARLCLIFWRLYWRHRLGQVTSRAPGSVGVVDEQLARRARGRVERVVPRGEENVVAVQLQGACEVDGVIAAQGVRGGEVAGVAGQRFVDRDDAQLGVEILECGDGADVR